MGRKKDKSKIWLGKAGKKFNVKGSRIPPIKVASRPSMGERIIGVESRRETPLGAIIQEELL